MKICIWSMMVLNVHLCATTADHQSTFVYIQDLSRRVGVYSGGDLLIGRLDSNGALLVEIHDVGAKSFTRLPIYQLITPSTIEGTRAVYEFRSGRLIKGHMLNGGRFIPDLGSLVLDFAEYKFSRNAIPIYNLPGYFREVKKDVNDDRPTTFGNSR